MPKIFLKPESLMKPYKQNSSLLHPINSAINFNTVVEYVNQISSDNIKQNHVYKHLSSKLKNLLSCLEALYIVLMCNSFSPPPHQIALLQQYPQLKQYIRPAVEKAVQDLLVPVAERSIKIALTTTEHIIRKVYTVYMCTHYCTGLLFLYMGACCFVWRMGTTFNFDLVSQKMDGVIIFENIWFSPVN
jgi:hypothetical protein